MVTLKYSLFFFLFISQLCFGQWFWQNPLPQGNHLLSVYFTGTYNGWTVGGFGTILNTNNAGATFIKAEEIDEVPTEFSLLQNYPNPFNPRTSIQYALSSRQFVQLNVYDLLGREIETLFNQEKSAGTYEVNWHAANLPSEVYFYQLKAGEFIQMKKCY